MRLDLDGDGTEERVRVRVDGDQYTARRLRVEADLSSTGALVFGVVDGGEFGYNLVDGIDADTDGDQEPVVYFANGDESTEVDLRVLDVVDGQIVELAQQGEPAIQNGAVLDREVDDRVSMKFQTAWWIADGTLYSSRSTQSYAFRDMSQSVPDPYLADLWAWQRDGDVLVPVAQDRTCIGNGDLGPEPVACPDDGGEVPEVFPEADDKIGMGESFQVDLDGGGMDTVALEPIAGVDGAELIVTTTYGGELRLGIQRPAAYDPEVFTTPINVGSWDSFALLVADEGGDSSSMTLVTASDGELVAVEEQGDVPFGGGFRGDDATPFRTWVGADDRMYTKVGPPLTSSDSNAPAHIYLWQLGQGPRLFAVDLGTFCEDTIAGEITRCDG